MAKRPQQTRQRVQAAQSRRSSHAAKAGVDFFESTAGAVEQLWRSGLDMASHFADRSSTQVGALYGLSGRRGAPGHGTIIAQY
jgi:hypothetical protein